ncbi:MAG: hypothetical protein D3908_09190, partial [Candidatus Electrothrix sp. AUS4]|nr:hypothetical protein [Candidatus Electrothrix sp. AUS4]
MIKQFLIKAGRKLKRLAGSGAKKKKEQFRSEQGVLEATEQHAPSPDKEADFTAGGQQQEGRRGD